jgi:hypothetical protein
MPRPELAVMKGNLIVGAAAFIASWALIGCSSGSQRSGSDQPSLVWIAQTYSGGRQCEPREDYAAPETRSVLEEAGVTVYETAARADAVCMACGCPAYAATHYAQIQSSDVDRAARLGFERSAPPEKVGSAMGAGSAALTGRVLYRERIALPADAVVRVRLVEAGEIAPSALAEQTIPSRKHLSHKCFPPRATLSQIPIFVTSCHSSLYNRPLLITGGFTLCSVNSSTNTSSNRCPDSSISRRQSP